MQDHMNRLLAAAEGGNPVVQASVLEAGPLGLVPGARMLVESSGEKSGTLGADNVDQLVAEYSMGVFTTMFAGTLYLGPDGLSERVIEGATSIFVEVVASKPVFISVGAGHIGRCLAHLADFLEFHVVVIDDREDFASEEKVPEADEVICEDFGTALDRYPMNASTTVVLVTRGHRQDEESLRHCLGRGVGYLGMIGSKRRTSTVLSHLAEEGYDRAELDRVRTPIGLDLGGESPEEIAVSILSEVIMLRAGGSGGPMYSRRAPHSEGESEG